MISDPGKLDQKIRREFATCSLGRWPTALDSAPALAARAGVDALWLKREDQAGGSKVRGLEFLLAAAPVDTVFVTIGGTGSTHCLATATHAARVGGQTVVAQFPQPPTESAKLVAAACQARAAAVVRSRTMLTFPLAIWRAWRLAGRLGPRRWIPGGGATAQAVIGHFLAGLELGAQLEQPPDAIVAPLGSSGTVGGLTLAMAALRWPTRVIGVRVASRMVANRGRASRLARGARELLTPIVARGEEQPAVVMGGYSAAYGAPTAAGEAARVDARAHGLNLDSTYGAKAFSALPEVGSRGFRRVVFWHTFGIPPAVEPL